MAKDDRGHGSEKRGGVSKKERKARAQKASESPARMLATNPHKKYRQDSAAKHHGLKTISKPPKSETKHQRRVRTAATRILHPRASY